MSLTETKIVDKIEILENGTVQVRESLRIMRGDEIVAQTFHRFTVLPGDDYSQLESKVQAICSTVQTQEVIDNYKEMAQAALLKQQAATF